MKIIFYGGKQAGMIALLTLLSLRHKVVCVIPVDGAVEKTAKNFNLNIREPRDINDKKLVSYLKRLKPDLLVCCHGRQILKKDILAIRCVNLHPCLYEYKGADPVGRLLKDGNKKASVGAHWMVEKVDRGGVIVEKFLKVEGKTPSEIYNELYPLYVEVLTESLKIINKK